MGYTMHLMEDHFVIKSENVDKALEAIKDLCKQEKDLGSGYSSLKGRTFSYVDTDEAMTAHDLKHAFHAWRWRIDLNDRGDLCGRKLRG